MRKKRFSLYGFLQLIRFPNLLIIGLTQYFAAIFLVGYPHGGFERLYDINLFLLSLSTIFIASAGYIINDYYDIKIDYINKPDKVVVGKLINRRIVLVSHFILNFLGILIALYLHVYIGIIYFLTAFLLWYYSNRLKRMAFIGNLAIALLTALSIMIVAAYYQKNIYLLTNYAIFAFSINLIREIIKDMEDLKGDLRFGSKTLPIVWGIRRTKIFLYVLIGLFTGTLFFLSYQLGNPVLNKFFLILILPIVYLLYLLYKADTQKRFYTLSKYCKIFMLTGILSMMFF